MKNELQKGEEMVELAQWGFLFNLVHFGDSDGGLGSKDYLSQLHW